MIDWLSNGETDKVIHTIETDIVRLVVEIKRFGKSSDEFDKEIGSSGGLQPKQADLNFVYALNELHSHEIRVVPSRRLSAPDKIALSARVVIERLYVKALTEEHADLVHAHESCRDDKAHYKECKKEMGRVEELEDEKKEAKQLSIEQADHIKHLKEALKQSEEDAHQLRLDSEVFSLAVGKGFIDGLFVGRKNEDVQAILKATPSIDPTSSNTFMEEYNKLFDKRYLHVEKVTRAYLLDPTSLQNVMSDETGPTHGQGSRDTPTASYA
nr:hypothetical protein [Tanacetum cinerariifolium]